MTNLLIAYMLFIIGAIDKMDDTKKAFKLANVPFSYKEYLSNEMLTLIKGALIPIAWYLLYVEVLGNYSFTKWSGISFAVMGLIGPYVLQKFGSKSRKFIDKITDDKTNVSDEHVDSSVIYDAAKETIKQKP